MTSFNDQLSQASIYIPVHHRLVLCYWLKAEVWSVRGPWSSRPHLAWPQWPHVSPGGRGLVPGVPSVHLTSLLLEAGPLLRQPVVSQLGLQTHLRLASVSTNQRPVFRSRDLYWPMRGQTHRRKIGEILRDADSLGQPRSSDLRLGAGWGLGVFTLKLPRLLSNLGCYSGLVLHQVLQSCSIWKGISYWKDNSLNRTEFSSNHKCLFFGNDYLNTNSSLKRHDEQDCSFNHWIPNRVMTTYIMSSRLPCVQ